MPVVNPGIRRFLGSAIQRLFNGASFSAPLTHSAIPTRAASGTTATFTRATTATVRDNEGVLRTAIAGEARFEGARRVRNLLPSSEDLTSGWTATGGTLAAGSITESGATSGHYAQTTSMVIPATAIFIMQAEIKQSVGTRNIGIGTNSVGNAIFNPSTGVFVANDGATLDHGTGTQTADGYWPVWVKVQATTSNKPIISLYSGTTQSYAGDGASQVLVRKLQLEDVTAQTTQISGEYVSVGVPSDWQGTELVTNGTFDTATTGWTAGNSATFVQSSGAAVLTNGAASNGYAYQAITTVVGAAYVLSGSLSLGTAPAPRLQAGTTIGGSELGSSQLTASGTFILAFTATGTTTYITAMMNSTTLGVAATYDNISVKPAYYHGSFVDGVKCYATDINGAAIPSSTLLGYQAEGARTNLCLQSNAFTTAPWANQVGTVGVAQDIVGPDGAVSAWTFTDNDGAVAEIYGANVGVLTAASYTFSIFVAKTTGAQSSYPVVLMYDGTATRIAAATVDTSNGIATIWTSYTGWTAVGSATCVSFNDDFWRVSITFTASTNVWVVNFVPAGALTATLAGPAFDASATGSAVFYGAQVELGSFASSYIPTTTAAVTRNADVLTYTGGDIPNLKTLMVGFDYPTIVDAATNYTVVSVDDGGLTTNSSTMRVAGDTLKLQTLTFSGSVLQSLQDHTNAINSASHKTALTWPANGIISVIDGGDAKTDASNAPPAGLTTLRIGLNSSGGQNLNGNIGPLYGWTRSLSQSELQAVTS